MFTKENVTVELNEYLLLLPHIQVQEKNPHLRPNNAKLKEGVREVLVGAETAERSHSV